ncbi:hypothetical protein JHK87_050943 [Glycine soja]|nr:hypothetical protein JHK87_050943 [Glycine soja]
MVGMTPLTRLLPDTYAYVCWSSLAELDPKDDEGAISPELSKVTSGKLASLSDNIATIFSSSLTTSSIDGLSSGFSWQQLRARDKNLSKQSDGHKPILLPIMEYILPDRQA